MKLVLRAHHLLCLKGFQGYGYSEEFVLNMTKINDLRKREDTLVLVTNTPDDICKACPNLKEGICKDLKHNEQIVKMDDEVLSHLNNDKEYNCVELFKQIDLIFNDRQSLTNICLECMWHSECLFYQKF